MSTLWVYVAFDGDHIGRKIGRASLANDVDEVRRIGQSIDAGNEIWRSWALSHGGEVIGIGGDEGRVRIGADWLGELPEIRTRYGDRVGATVAVGVGQKLGEADRALMAAKLSGGDQIRLYTPEVEDIINNAPEKTEAEKIRDEYLNKAQPALNKPAGGGGMTGPSMAPQNAPAAPAAEGSEHSETEALQSQIEAAPPPPEATHAARDLHQEFKASADEQQQKDASEQQDQQQAQDGQKGKQDLKAQVINILKTFRERAAELEGIQKQDPELYKAMVGMVQSMIAMAKQVWGGDQVEQPEVQKSEKKYKLEGDAIIEVSAGGHSLGHGNEMEKIEGAEGSSLIADTEISPEESPPAKGVLHKDGLCDHFYGKGSSKCLRCKAPKDLKKEGLKAGKTGRHRVELPVGSQIDASASATRDVGQLKVQDPATGKTKWRSVRAGLVMAPDGTPVSSRNPGG